MGLLSLLVGPLAHGIQAAKPEPRIELDHAFENQAQVILAF